MNPLQASELLGDHDVVTILAMTQESPMGVKELMQALKISMASCYRKLQILRKVGLLQVRERWNKSTGRKDKVYVSQVRGLQFVFDGSRLKLRLQPRPGAENIDDIWNVIDVKTISNT